MFFTKPKELGGRRGIPTHYILRAKDVCWLLFIGLKLLPWASIILWYLFFVCACPSIKLRKGMLRDVCAAPFQGQHAEDEWYQDFWNVKHAPKYIGTRNSSRTYLQVLMVGHLQLRDSMRALNDQARQAALQTPDLFTQEMQSDLKGVISFSDSLVPYWENFSRTFCAEKDNLNHAFLSYVNAYIRAIRHWDCEEILWASYLLAPSWFFNLRVVNYYTRISWLPEPALYCIHVRSEMEYERNKFLDTSLEIFKRIETAHSDMQSFRYGRSYSIDTLGRVASKTIENYEQSLNKAIETQRNTSWSLFFLPKSPELQNLEDHLARCLRMRNQLQTPMSIPTLYKDSVKRFIEELEELRTNSFSSAPRPFEGIIELPTSLQKRLSLGNFARLKSPSIIGAHPETQSYEYSMQTVIDTDIVKARSEFGEVCKKRQALEISGALADICRVVYWAMRLSGYDDELLGFVPASWVLERVGEMRRYDQGGGVDFWGVAMEMNTLATKFLEGTPVPVYVP